MSRRTRAYRRQFYDIPNHFPVLAAVLRFFRSRMGVAALLLAAMGTFELWRTRGQWAADRVVSALAGAPELAAAVAVGAVCSVLVALSLWRRGYLGGLRLLQDHRDYEREDPVHGVHPAVVSRLWNGCALTDDIVLALLSLASRGYVSLRDGGAAGSRKGDLRIAVDASRDPAVLPPLDRLMFGFLLKESGGGERELALLSLLADKGGRKAPRRHRDFIREFFQEERKEAIESGLFLRHAFEGSGSGYGEGEGRVSGWGFLFCLSIASPAILLVVLYLMGGSVFALFTLPVARWLVFLPWLMYAVLVLLFDMRRSAEGRRVLARCRGLRRWLKDFTLLPDAGATAVAAWGPYAVYAYLLDVSEPGIDELRQLGDRVDRIVADAVCSESLLSDADDEMRDYHRVIQGEPVVFPDEVERGPRFRLRDLFKNHPGGERAKKPARPAGQRLPERHGRASAEDDDGRADSPE